MRRVAVTLLLSVVVACGTYGVRHRYAGEVDRSKEDAFSCVMSQVTEWGYTVKEADRGAGIIEARKKIPGVKITGESGDPVLEVSIVEADTAQRINVTSTYPEEEGRGKQLIEACGASQVDTLPTAPQP